MTTAVDKLLESFDALAAREKQAAAAALLRRVAEFKQPELPYLELLSAADALLVALDLDETDGAEPGLNLDNNPTIKQLRRLLVRYDDQASSHLLWVKRNGDVEISPIATPQMDWRSIRNEPCVAKFQREHPEMQMRCETFLAGRKYVGREPAANQWWISEFFDILLSEWQAKKGSPDVAYISLSDR